ncbi:hypothetical protein C4579_04745 [Candidatus Microgenomates bacterium]|nr:MAG: hypothetical protein C4579_04745 [Candidatus Microgenomates bacterium]
MPAQPINLLPRKDFDRTIFGKFLRWSLIYGRYIIVSTEIVVLLAFIARFSLDRTITDLNEEIDQKAAIVTANQGFEDRFRNLQNRTTYIGQFLKKQDALERLLSHLQTITPQGVRLVNLTLTDEIVSVDAVAQTSSSLAAFLSNLKNSDTLTDISVTNVTKKTTQTAETTVKIEAVLRAK